MAESTKAKNMRDGTITFLQGANSYVFKYEKGTLKLDVPGPSVSVYRDRGRFNDSLHGAPSLRYNEDQPIKFSFDCYLRDVSDGSYVTAPEFINQSGQYFSTWGSSLGASEEVRTVDLQWDIAATGGDTTAHQMLVKYAVINGGFAEGDPDMVNISGEAYDLYPAVI